MTFQEEECNMARRIFLCVALIAAIAVAPSAAVAQTPGDCNGDGIALSVGDLTVLLTYLSGGAQPAGWANCDCDNNPGITMADAYYLTYYLYFGFVQFFGSPGTYFTEPSHTHVFTVNKTSGPSASIDVWIAVASNETIGGLSLPFSFAPTAPGQATVSISSVRYTNSPFQASLSHTIDNVNKTLVLRKDPVPASSTLPPGTLDTLCVISFTQDSPGSPIPMVLANTSRYVPQLYPTDFVDPLQPMRGARVLTPAFADIPLGDVTCDNFADIDDIVGLINYVFSAIPICYR
jgi:hypothetical protein